MSRLRWEVRKVHIPLFYHWKECRFIFIYRLGIRYRDIWYNATFVSGTVIKKIWGPIWWKFDNPNPLKYPVKDGV